MAGSPLVERLAAFAALGGLPQEELEWLAAHGEVMRLAAGETVLRRGELMEHLYVVLDGRIAVHRDRGAGRRKVMEWVAGDVTGKLPYSRAGRSESSIVLEVETKLLAVSQAHFREMAYRCPEFTAHSVHLMLDRAREFRTSDLQEEKMISLGKLAAGLAHELNNPASATVRGAKLLGRGLTDMGKAVRTLGGTSLGDRQIEALERFRDRCAAVEGQVPRSALEQTDREDEIAAWLEERGLDPEPAASLAETAVDVPALEQLAGEISGDALTATLQWIARDCEAKVLAAGIERAATRIHDLVDAVKRFTYMDQRGRSETLDVQTGLRDTIRVLSSKASAKRATVTLDVEEGLPSVRANGGELNQVWLNLIDNALDAIPESGHVEITAVREHDRVVVRVEDDGAGIDPDVMPHIFDPFFTTKEPGEGVGLGLEAVQRLLRQSDGEVVVESRPGRTEFRVSLASVPDPDS